MTHITLVYAYYENGGMLDRHLEEWSQYTHKNKYRAIIVDDHSKRDPAENHLKGVDVGFPISLFRIDDDIPWNQNGARNLAMTNAAGWCLMTDMDHLLSKKSAKKLLSHSFRRRNYYRPMRRLDDDSEYHQHPNTYVIHKEDYWKIGGYDESFAGYYGSDATFRRQLKEKYRYNDLPDVHLNLYKREVIPDASTTDFGRKNTKYHVSANSELADRRRKKLPPIKPLNFKYHKVDIS